MQRPPSRTATRATLGCCRVHRLAAAAFLTALLACSDGTHNPVIVDVPSIEMGAARTDVEPGDTVLVLVTAMAGGTSFPGAELQLAVNAGSGAVTDEHVVTDENGVAVVHWILEATEDSQALRVVAPASASLTLRPRWTVRSVELDTTGIGIIVDSAALRATVRNRIGGVLARKVTTSIVSTPDFEGLEVARLDHGMVFAHSPGRVTLNAVSEDIAATPVQVRVAPRVAVLASFDQAAPAVSGDTVTARGYRLDLAGELSMGGVRAGTALVDSTMMRVVLPPIDTTACRGGPYLPAALKGGIVLSPGVRVRRPSELSLAPGELVPLGIARTGCIRLAPIAGAQYVLMFLDTRPIAAAEQGFFPWYGSDRYEFAVGFDSWPNGPATSVPVPPAQAAAIGPAGPDDVVRVTPTATAPSDAIELRAAPFRVGDRASVGVAGTYEGGTIVRLSDPFVAMVLDREPVPDSVLARFDEVMLDVQREGVPLLRAALSRRTPLTSTGSGQYVIVLSAWAAQGYAGLAFGPAVAVGPRYIGVNVVTHELAHAWQDRFNRDECGENAPFACWYGSRWATEGGASFLADETDRRLAGKPLVGAAPPPGFSFSCQMTGSPSFGDGYISSMWFLRDLLVRAVVAGANYDSALAAVSRGALEGWYASAPDRGLAHRMTALLGTPWNPPDAYETSVWSLGMDESAAPDRYQYLGWRDYHFGQVGTVGESCPVLAGRIAGDGFGHVQLDDHGAGGSYRFSVAADGFRWAIGRVR